jgi:hypothetical protein
MKLALKRRQLFVALAAVILVVSAAVIAAYIYALPPIESQLSIVGEDQTPFWSKTGLIILCSTKARQMGLCTTPERQLHAKYTITVDPPPPSPDRMTITCQVILKNLYPETPGKAGTWMRWPTFEVAYGFVCTVTRQAPEGKFELDLALTVDPDSWPPSLIGSYFLLVTVNYDEPLLSWMPLIARKASGATAGDLCILNYHVGEFRSCDEAASSQRQTLDASNIHPRLSVDPSTSSTRPVSVTKSSLNKFRIQPVRLCPSIHVHPLIQF